MRTPLTDPLKRLRAFIKNFDTIVIQEAKKDAHLIPEMNRDQLYAGHGTDGKDLTPSYQSDPYFKTPDAAQRYSDWKDKITPSPFRNPGTPNLFINGQFHNTITTILKSNEIEVKSNSDIASKVQNKYGHKVFGLTPRNKGIFAETKLKPRMQKRFKKALFGIS